LLSRDLGDSELPSAEALRDSAMSFPSPIPEETEAGLLEQDKIAKMKEQILFFY
jgi:hypothetical protein